jgi:hypothetical protein
VDIRRKIASKFRFCDSASGFKSMARKEYFRMHRSRLVDQGAPSLKDQAVSVIELVCLACNRREAFERKLLVKAFGAGATFGELRRRMAMGCDRMQTPQGDKCGAHFPCLDAEQSADEINR